MKDGSHIARATASDGRVRAYAIDATGVVAELQQRHGTYPAVTAALGRTAMGALLLAAASLKEEAHVLTVEVHGDGPAGRILCTANGRGEVRGLAGNPRAHAESVGGKLNVGGVVGRSGYLSVTRDAGMRGPYRGLVELQTGEIGDDLAVYLARSEQVPSAIGVGVFVEPSGRVSAAGGFLVQLLPGVGDEEAARIEGGVSRLPHPTSLIREGTSPGGVLSRIFPEGYVPMPDQPVRFHCPCSRDRFERGLVSLGEVELEGLVAGSGGEVELVCRFCNEVYRIPDLRVRELAREAR